MKDVGIDLEPRGPATMASHAPRDVCCGAETICQMAAHHSRRHDARGAVRPLVARLRSCCTPLENLCVPTYFTALSVRSTTPGLSAHVRPMPVWGGCRVEQTTPGLSSLFHHC